MKRRDFIRSGFLAGLAATILKPRPGPGGDQAGAPAPRPAPDRVLEEDLTICARSGDGVFIAVGATGRIYRSENGITWTERSGKK